MKELFEALRATERKLESLENLVQEILGKIVASEGHGPFTFDSRTFVIAKNGGKWVIRNYDRPEPKVIE